jgi:hypothetical protein
MQLEAAIEMLGPAQDFWNIVFIKRDASNMRGNVFSV